MGIIHFLNVKEGDCIWIKHPSDHNTIIDISNGFSETVNESVLEYSAISGNYNQKAYPVNPIEYLKDFNVKSIFRFILTHPDMDHMDGLKELFENFSVTNFWDTANDKVMKGNDEWGKYKKEDWDFYQHIRKSDNDPIVLNLYSGSKGKYYNQDEDGKSGADGLYILAPTKELVDESNKSKDYNDASYVIMYRTGASKKIVFAGDSADKTWEYILTNYKNDVSDIDVLIAPHHGRSSGGNDNYLDVLKPKITLFGNAKSKYLDYNSWNNRELLHITNNQANCVILNTNGTNGIDIYVTNEKFARDFYQDTAYNKDYRAWYIHTV